MSKIKDYIPSESGKTEYTPNNKETEELKGIIKELFQIIKEIEVDIWSVNNDDSNYPYYECPVCKANVEEGGHYESCPISIAKNLKYYIKRKLGIELKEEE